MSQEQDEFREVREAAMRCLARRDYSFQELCTVLRAKGFASEVVHSVLEGYRERGLQSDHRFAEMYIRSRAARGCGPVRIELELRQRGVADEVISLAMAESGMDWVQRLRELQVKKFGRRPVASAADRAKQWRFLQYKGFSAEAVQQVLQSLDLADV